MSKGDLTLACFSSHSASPLCLGGFTSAVSVWMFGKSSLRWRLAWRCVSGSQNCLMPLSSATICLYQTQSFRKWAAWLFWGFFSPVVGLQTDPGTWMKVLLLRASVQSCSAMRQVTSLCLWQMYQSTLGLRTHHPKAPRSLVYLVKLEVTITQSWLLL